MRIKLFRIYILFILGVFIFVISFSVNGFIERKIIKTKINEFTNSAQLISPSENFNYDINTYRYYMVKNDYNYESLNNFDLNTNYIGTTGDILLTNRNPIPELEFLSPIVRYFWLGHAALVIDDNGKYILEIVGNDALSINYSQVSINEFSSEVDAEVIGLRLNNIDNKFKDSLMDIKDNYLNKKYNYMFLLPLANRFYCLDLISRIYKELDVNLNYDFFITTGSDLIVSKKMHIFYYSYTDSNNIIHRYFLE